jgi:hypothetical protein
MSWLSDLFDGGTKAAAAAANQQTALITQQQQAHDAAVASGKANIDSAFSAFTPDYYSGVSTAYDNAYEPQLMDQYNISKDQLTAQLAGNDTLEGTVGANALSQLQKTYNTNQAQIADQGVNAANTLKHTVSNHETNLYSMNASAADPSAAATEAQAQAGVLVSPQSYNTLSKVFGAVLSPFAAAQKSNSTSLGAFTPSGPTATLLSAQGSGSIT